MLSGVVYRVKSTGPSTEPCGIPYESVTLSDRVSLIFNGVESGRQVKQGQRCNLTLIHTNNYIVMYFQ